MHPTLCIPEILDDIFSHIDPLELVGLPLPEHLRTPKSFIVALSTTCKAFKEPALNVLWGYLPNLTPLVTCLPEGSWVESGGVCALNKQLEQADWRIILGYSRRVRVLSRLVRSGGVSVDTLKVLSQSPSAMFPRLRTVTIVFPLPQEMSCFAQQFMNTRLTNLIISTAKECHDLGNVIDIFGKGCLNVNFFEIERSYPLPSDTISSLLCHWRHLRHVGCIYVDLNVTALAHLSCMPNLDHLDLKLNDELVQHVLSSPNTSITTFLRLRKLSIHYDPATIHWQFFSHLRVSVMNDLSIRLVDIPDEEEFISLLTTLPNFCPRDTLHRLSLALGDLSFAFDSLYPDDWEDDRHYYITLGHLHLLTMFVNLRSIHIDINCAVDLKEREFLSLVSYWPHLQEFSVCDHNHWTRSSCLTPDGFILLVEKCRSLSSLYFNFDASGCTEVSQGHPWRGLSMPQDAFFHMQSSPIEEASVHALSVFFHVAPFPNFGLSHWWYIDEFRDSDVPDELCNIYADRWNRVEIQARRLWEDRQALKRELIARFTIPS